MATILYDQLWKLAAAAGIDWASGTVKVALMGSGYTPAKDDGPYWDDIEANEIAAGGGYTQIAASAGKDLANKSVTNAVLGTVRLLADDPEWAASTITASYAVIVLWKTSSADSPILACLDFGGSKSSSSSNFKIDFNSGGADNAVITLAQAA